MAIPYSYEDAYESLQIAIGLLPEIQDHLGAIDAIIKRETRYMHNEHSDLLVGINDLFQGRVEELTETLATENMHLKDLVEDERDRRYRDGAPYRAMDYYYHG